MKDKNDEMVLVIPRSSFNPEEFLGSYTDFSKLVDKHAIFLKRGIAETDETHLQLIPYAVMTFDYKYIFTYRRLKAGSENRLHNKYSIGIGGHINDHDVSHNSTMTDVLITGALREINEEVFMPWTTIASKLSVPEKNFLIYDPSNEVGRVHLGIVMVYNSLSSSIRPKETDKIEGKLMNINYLKRSDLQFENWTKQVLSWMT